MKNKTRQYTRDEARELFLEHIWHLVDYWEREDRRPTSREKLEGLAFSILSSLDGSSLSIPPMKIVPIVSKADKNYMKKEGRKWFLEEDIGGSLHEIFYPVGRKSGYTKK